MMLSNFLQSNESVMSFTHACFLSFPRGAGNASKFADLFYDELKDQIAVYGKDELSIFKYDQCEERRQGDDWTLWIQKELCHSAMMVAVCAPTFFTGSSGCVSEFDGMEELARQRCDSLSEADKKNDWIVGLRLKPDVPLPKLNAGYHVVDFYDCCASPAQVRSVNRNRKKVEALADRIYKHWQWVKHHPRLSDLQQADLCANFSLPGGQATPPDAFPHPGGVR
jgi:hypothetical protein